MVPQTVLLRGFVDPHNRSLETIAQARRVIDAIEPHSRRWVELDFSGVAGVSWEFTVEFIQLAQAELPEVWLTPKRYDHRARKLVALLVSRLKLLREEEWIKGCERFSTGEGPGEDGPANMP
jgi:hypothetical protein